MTLYVVGEIGDWSMSEKDLEGIPAVVRDTFYDKFMKRGKVGFWYAVLREPIALTAPEDEQLELLFKHAVIVECNAAFAKMYGYAAPAALVDTPLLQFVSRNDAQNMETLRVFVRKRYSMESAETHETDNRGAIRWFVNDVEGTIVNDKLVSIWGMQREITAQKKVTEERSRFLKSISPQDRIILQLRTEGYSIKEVANVLNRSYSTIHTHIHRMRKKLDLSSDGALLNYAKRIGFPLTEISNLESTLRRIAREKLKPAN
jgi:DNA-binding CsgD family transcriptional regulator